jgi:hypothetical protein
MNSCLQRPLSLFLVVIAWIPYNSSANSPDSCSTIDLRSKNYSMENVNKTHQNLDLGVCYAHGAVKALESKMKVLGIVPKDFKASIFAAFATNEQKNRFADPLDKNTPKELSNRQNVAFGNFCQFMDQIKKEGVCNYKNFEGTATALTSLKASTEKTPRAESKSFYLLNKLEKHYKKSVAETSPQVIKDYLESLNTHLKALQEEMQQTNQLHDTFELSRQQNLIKDKIAELDRLFFNAPNSCSVSRRSNSYRKYFELKKDVDKVLIKLSPLGYLREVVNTNCGIRENLSKHPEIAKLGCETNELFTKSSLEEKLASSQAFIDAEFSKGTQAGPIGINYVAGFLLGKEKQETNPNSNHASALAVNGVSHLSLIIGRKKIQMGKGNGSKEVCAYLIRNSLGKDCDVYNKSNLELKCEDGDTWVEDRELMKRTNALYNPFSDKVGNRDSAIDLTP